MISPNPKIPRLAGAPRHVAIIMDGNGRWAKQRGLPRQAGHRAGVKSARRVVEYMAEQGVEYLTMFAFSSENWQRPRDEVKALMGLFADVLKRETADLHRNGVRLRFIGDRTTLGKRLTKRIEEAEALTGSNSGLKLDIAMAYGGRWDIVQAARRLADDVQAGRLGPNDITECTLADRLVTGDAPEPDLVIRTGGEQRISNFLLWQGAYAELFFSQALWPDFSDEEIDAALEFYSVRQRRFGRTGEQVGVKPC